MGFGSLGYTCPAADGVLWGEREEGGWNTTGEADDVGCEQDGRC